VIDDHIWFKGTFSGMHIPKESNKLQACD